MHDPLAPVSNIHTPGECEMRAEDGTRARWYAQFFERSGCMIFACVRLAAS